MQPVLLIILIFCSLLITSCGKKKSGGGSAAPQSAQEAEGIYSATIYPLNGNLAANMTGAVTITKYGDDFNVRVKMRKAPSGMHMQALYSGTLCPDTDSNNDAYIDIQESQARIGKVLVPFDGELRSHDEGSDYYPTNSYAYERSTSFSVMMSDSNLKKEKLTLEGKVVVIHGIAESHALPSSVANMGGYSSQKMIPIGCGILTYLTEIPTDEPDEEIPANPRPRRPREDEQPEIPYEPKPPEEEHHREGRWGRMRDRLDRWWDRIWRRGRGHDDQGDDKP